MSTVMTSPYQKRFELNDDDLEQIWTRPHLLGNLAGKDRLSDIHSDWIRYIWDGNEERALMAHRGSYKTTSICVIGAIRWMLFHPDDRIAIVRKTFSDAAEVVNTVRVIIEKSFEIQALFAYAHGCWPKAIVKQNGRLTYNFKASVTPEANLTAHGLDGSLTGKHYDKIIGDDFVTLKDRMSKAERERTKEMVRELNTNIIDPGKYIGWIGTPWHERDAWEVLTCPILKFKASECGILTPEDMERKKKTTTPFLYAANYELELHSDEDALFREPKFGKWDLLCPGVVGQLDAAFDGDHTCALTFMARKPDGRVQAKGWVYEGNVKDWIPEIARLCKLYRVQTLYNETNPDKGYTADKLKAYNVPVTTYQEGQNKHIKISSHLYELWHEIDWDEDTQQEYLEQVTDYREGQEPDDAPDSAASLVRQHFSIKPKTRAALYSWS